MNKTIATLILVIIVLVATLAFMLGQATGHGETNRNGDAVQTNAELAQAASAPDKVPVDVSQAKGSDADEDAIWRDGKSIGGSCYAKVGRTVFMDGGCSGLGHGNSLFVTADADGCSFDIELQGMTASGTLFAYRNACGDLDSEGVAIGPFKKQGGCWAADNARFCLKPGD